MSYYFIIQIKGEAQQLTVSMGDLAIDTSSVLTRLNLLYQQSTNI